MDELERHRVARRLHGFPIFDEDEIVDVVDEPEWEWSDLTDDQRATINREALRLQRGRELSWNDAFAFILGEYGIRCPHSWEDRSLTWRECRWCRCGEQLPGRVVNVGGRWMRVLDPPPQTLRIPQLRTPSAIYEDGPGAISELRIDEYRWTGTGYRLA